MYAGIALPPCIFLTLLIAKHDECILNLTIYKTIINKNAPVFLENASPYVNNTMKNRGTKVEQI